jgi:hypothetical protein
MVVQSILKPRGGYWPRLAPVSGEPGQELSAKLGGWLEPIGVSRLFGNGGENAQSFVLATCLSTICDRLDLVRDWNLDQPDTWGAVGHFAIASRVAGPLSGDVPRLAELMKNNASIISHDDDTILNSEFNKMSDVRHLPNHPMGAPMAASPARATSMSSE